MLNSLQWVGENHFQYCTWNDKKGLHHGFQKGPPDSLIVILTIHHLPTRWTVKPVATFTKRWTIYNFLLDVKLQSLAFRIFVKATPCKSTTANCLFLSMKCSKTPPGLPNFVYQHPSVYRYAIFVIGKKKITSPQTKDYEKLEQFSSPTWNSLVAQTRRLV